MSMSIAKSRRPLSALIDLAQIAPQVITRNKKPIAVLVSIEYFERMETTVEPKLSFYEHLMAVREKLGPLDDSGRDFHFQIDKVSLSNASNRSLAWNRANSFLEPD